MKDEIIILGTGGHSSVVLDAIWADGTYEPIGFIDLQETWQGDPLPLPYLGSYDTIVNFPNHAFVIALGNASHREQVANQYALRYPVIIHPSAVMGSQVTIGEGTVVLAHVTINAHTRIGKHCILNTACVIEHHNQLGDYVHMAPACATGGQVNIDHHCLIGIHASVLPNHHIASHVTLGAHSVATKNITVSGTYIGCPAIKT